MKLHLVGGFLGSGKTTAIIAAAKTLMAEGLRVGVVTNDQGKYLVDTAFFALSDIPTVEVTGGCFCCNYDDLQSQLDQLTASSQPDVIFAESVGSCADLIATVVRPLLELRPGQNPPTSFSVFADSRLLLLRLLDLPLPFNEDVVYIFDKQIEEAGLLIVNKFDLLSEAERTEMEAMVRERFPGMPVRFQNSLSPAEVAGWLDDLQDGRAAPPETTLEIDYQRYGAGEAHLAWLDERVVVSAPPGKMRPALVDFIETLTAKIRSNQWAVGHLKFILQDGEKESKLSFTALDTPGWQDEVPHFGHDQAQILINARVETGAEMLHQLVQEVLNGMAAAHHVSFTQTGVDYFHPGFPTPTHRVT
jgi:Ni2+-binding GTPase involved in maturation of urease and hydrogenase